MSSFLHVILAILSEKLTSNHQGAVAASSASPASSPSSPLEAKFSDDRLYHTLEEILCTLFSLMYGCVLFFRTFLVG